MWIEVILNKPKTEEKLQGFKGSFWAVHTTAFHPAQEKVLMG